jgi:hypothetical protein
MNTLREAATHMLAALDALKGMDRLEQELRAALAEQPKKPQEPYAWMAVGGTIWRHKTTQDDVPLYTAPQPRRQPLTREEIDAVMRQALGYGLSPSRDDLELVRAIEAAHGITKE